MKNLFKLVIPAVLAIATINLNFPVGAQETRLEQLRADLQVAVCLNEWDEATTLASQIIGLDEITQEYRQQMMGYRRRLIDWRASQASLGNVPGCEEIIFAHQMPEPEPVQVDPANWDAAIRYSETNRPTGRSLNPYWLRSGGNSSVMRGYPGICQGPWQTASDGSRCGGR